MKLLPIHLLGLAAIGGGAIYLASKKSAPAPGTSTTTTTTSLTPAQTAAINQQLQAQAAAMMQQGLNSMGFGAAQTPQPDEQSDPTSTVSQLAQQGTDAANNAVQQGTDAVNNAVSSLF